MTRRDATVATLLVAALALAVGWSSLANGFAYDDVYILEKAGRHSMSGWWRDFATTYWPISMGGDGYRPLTVTAVRAPWVLGGCTRRHVSRPRFTQCIPCTWRPSRTRWANPS